MAANKSARSLADVLDQAQNARAARFAASFADCVASNADCAAPPSALIENRSNTYFSQGMWMTRSVNHTLKISFAA
jgi:hypothetical protein